LVSLWSKQYIFVPISIHLELITWNSSKGRAVSGPFPLLFPMSDFFFNFFSIPEMQKESWKKNWTLTWQSLGHVRFLHILLSLRSHAGESAALQKSKSHLMVHQFHGLPKYKLKFIQIQNTFKINLGFLINWSQVGTVLELNNFLTPERCSPTIKLVIQNLLDLWMDNFILCFYNLFGSYSLDTILTKAAL